MAARIMLAKTAKPSLPLHLLRGPLSSASAPLNLNLQPPNHPADLQQIPPRADESPVPACGLSSLLQQLRSADLELRRKSVPAKDDDDDDDLDDEDGSDGCLDGGDYVPEFFSRREDDDSDFYDSDDYDDDDDDEKGKGRYGRRRK